MESHPLDASNPHARATKHPPTNTAACPPFPSDPASFPFVSATFRKLRAPPPFLPPPFRRPPPKPSPDSPEPSRPPPAPLHHRKHAPFAPSPIRFLCPDDTSHFWGSRYPKAKPSRPPSPVPLLSYWSTSFEFKAPKSDGRRSFVVFLVCHRAHFRSGRAAFMVFYRRKGRRWPYNSHSRFSKGDSSCRWEKRVSLCFVAYCS